MIPKTNRLLLLIVFLFSLMCSQIQAGEISPPFDIDVIVKPPTDNSGLFNAMIGLGKNATTSNALHSIKIKLEPENLGLGNSYKFISCKIRDKDGDSVWTKGTVPGNSDAIGWDVTLVDANSKANIYGKFSKPGTGPGTPLNYDIKVAIVDIEIPSVPENKEVPGPYGGPYGLTMVKGQGAIKCKVVTANLPSSSTAVVVSGSPFRYSKTASGPPKSSIELPLTDSDFYIWPGTTSGVGTIEAKLKVGAGVLGLVQDKVSAVNNLSKIQTLTATEAKIGLAASATVLTSNSLTVTGLSSDRLYVSNRRTPLKHWFALDITFDPIQPPPVWSKVLFKVDGIGSTSGSGDFGASVSTLAGQPRIGIEAGVFYTVDVGIDSNGNGALENIEITHSLRVSVLNFTGSYVSAKRTSTPTENLYPIKEGEHFEVGGTFHFELKGGNTGSPSLVKYQLWDFDGPNDLIVKGSGISFSHTFSSGIEEGNVYIKFYGDRDEDDKFDEPFIGLTEYGMTSESFWVQKRKDYDIKVDISSKISPAVSSAIIQSRLDGAADLLGKKDSANDYRAVVNFNAVSVTRFTATPAGGARPEPVINDRIELDKHFNAPADIVFVDQLFSRRAVTAGNDWHRIIIEWENHAKLMEKAIAHEMGHGVGLEHLGHLKSHIMYKSATTGVALELTKSDAEAYDQ